jgi:hypothetical protein
MAGEQDAMPAVLKVNLLHTWAKMKTQSDKRRFNVHFQVGDWVLLNLQPQDSGHKILRLFKQMKRKIQVTHHF